MPSTTPSILVRLLRLKAAVGIAAAMSSLLSLTTAFAATRVVEGEFAVTADIPSAEIYDATGANAYVEQGRNNYGFIVRRSPANARWVGGRVFGQGANRTGAWRVTYDRGNGAGLIVHESPGITVEGFYAEWAWDGIRPARNTSGTIQIRRVWLNQIRDDAIESDHLGTWSSVRVEDSLIEDVFVLHSTRRGASATGPTPPHRLEYVGNVISLGPHLMDVNKREHPWSGPIPGFVTGQTFKSEGNGTNMSLLFRNNVVKLVKAGAFAPSVLNILPANAKIDPASGGNILVWLGGSPAGLEMETIDGVRVPKDFKIDRKLWRVTDDPKVWLDARNRWAAKIWDSVGARPPASPAALTAKSAARDQVRLSWSDRSDNETGFRIERKVGPSGTYSVIGAVGRNGTSFTDVQLPADGVGWYRVRAFNALGESPFSAEVEARAEP